MIGRPTREGLACAASGNAMTFRRLQYCVKIVDVGSLTQAADILHVAQPALSQQLATLEAEVRQKLLEAGQISEFWNKCLGPDTEYKMTRTDKVTPLDELDFEPIP